jgi:hypothetical protein
MRAEQPLDLTRKMTREPLLMPLRGLAKDLDHEGNGWGAHQGKAGFLKQFPPKPNEQRFPGLHLSAWQSPVRAQIAWITLLDEEQLSTPPRSSLVKRTQRRWQSAHAGGCGQTADAVTG